ncbi:MAG TPA: DUF4331 family protein [Thermoanaerobaculia bacterium]|nr:DUF4331 family protein [Thermoanaerobaculia bacterium]
MRQSRALLLVVASAVLIVALVTGAADHNDPNAVNAIFSDNRPNGADLYDMFGHPADDRSRGENVVLALTFADAPQTGVLDTDVLYRIRIYPTPRPVRPSGDNASVSSYVAYVRALKDRFETFKGGEVRVTTNAKGEAKLSFVGFPGGNFAAVVKQNTAAAATSPGGQRILMYVGGRDDAFFNDLPGFFRSINYGPEFYKVNLTQPEDLREMPIPKTLLALEGNGLFNDPEDPAEVNPDKPPLPPGPYTWKGNRYYKDEKGNYRFVYSGRDARAGLNVNAIILEVPLAYFTKSPRTDRVVNTWGESWVLKASDKVDTIPDRSGFTDKVAAWFSNMFSGDGSFDEDLTHYKRVDTDGLPFSDAALSERHDDRQLGADNFRLAPHFINRFGHLGWGFGPSITALGLPTCFDHSGVTVSTLRFYKDPLHAFPRVKRCFFQELNMPPGVVWNPKRLNIPLRRAADIFIPNVNAIDMDTTGTWPFGRRFEDQVATRFLSVFLDHTKSCAGAPCNLETLGQQSLWNAAPIEPKTPPNPLRNDKPFLRNFPYMASPWPAGGYAGQ